MPTRTVINESILAATESSVTANVSDDRSLSAKAGKTVTVGLIDYRLAAGYDSMSERDRCSLNKIG